MSLFRGPAEHTDNPPETWTVRKVADRAWLLCTKDGGALEQRDTKRAAEALRTEGALVDLYRRETRWYAGEPVANWKPYHP